MFKNLYARIVSFFMSILMALGLVAAPENPDIPDSPEKPSVITLSQELTYELNTNSKKYVYAQGACSDNEFIYILMNENTQAEDAKSVIYKIDPESKSVVFQSPELEVCFGSDMAYNSKTNEIVIADATPRNSVVSIIDAETLTFKREVDLGYNIYGITYNDNDGYYYTAISGGKAIGRVTADFKKIGTIGVRQDDFTRQSINLSGNFLYLLGSAPNTFRTFDLIGQEYDTYRLDETYKTAALVTCNGKYYVTYALGNGKCRLCELVGFNGQAEKVFSQEIVAEFPAKNGFKVVQGGCCSDKYIYQLMHNNTTDLSALYVIDPTTWTVVNHKDNLPVDHGNDMCWNSKTNELIVLHGMPNKSLLSFYDPETLEFKRTVDVKKELFSIEYDKSENCYYAGIAGAKTFVKFSSNFRKLKTLKMSNNDYTQQGMTIVGDNLYFVFWKENSFRIYNKKGGFVKEYLFPVNFAEPENAFVFGDALYIVYNKTDYTGGLIYRLNDFTV